MHIRQSEISSLEAVHQPGVINPQCLQNGRMQVVYVHGVLHNVVGKVVSFSPGHSWSDTATGHPHGEAPRVVIATVII
jgi:hypothetical protein